MPKPGFGKTLIGVMILTMVVSPAIALDDTILFNFNDRDQQAPVAALLRGGDGVLYGTTAGGTEKSHGTAFELTPGKDGKLKYTLLHKFGARVDGSDPWGALIQDSSGIFYGTTSIGGTYGKGTVFQLSQTNGMWTETVLYNFTGGADGSMPYSTLVEDAGVLYGTTAIGGASGSGTVFGLSQSGGVWTETVLHNFTFGDDGGEPRAGLLLDGSGALYGTTVGGGAAGYGTVFKLAPSGGVWTESIIHSFHVNDGGGPTAGLVEDSGGNLYGATGGGGDLNCSCGVIFELTELDGKWKEKVLHVFTGQADGGMPLATPYLDTVGNLYGVASVDGLYNLGTLFELSPIGKHWNFKARHEFGSGSDGGYPQGAVIQDPNSGALYGTTTFGGSREGGTVYEMDGVPARPMRSLDYQ